MKGNVLLLSSLTLIAWAGAAVTPAHAQGPIFDRVDVNLPYTVTLGDATLQPGDYTIKELASQDRSRVLVIYSDGGLKYEATVNAIPAEKNRTPENTQVLLHHYGPDYYFDKIWVAGKNYGYEFPVPANIKERQREREAPVSVAATYQAPAEPVAAQATTPAVPSAPATAPGNDQVAQNTPPPEQAAQNAPPPQNAQNPEPQQTAQNAPPPAPEVNTSADRQTDQNPTNQQLPATSADWVMMLLGGGGLSGIGLALRRKRNSSAL
jgi:LPXTG-motif cell wall-anchored protein